MTVAFGSQAARFDTAGIHPDRKLPGHFIQYTYTREATNNEMSHIGKSPRVQFFFIHRLILNPVLFPIFV